MYLLLENSWKALLCEYTRDDKQYVDFSDKIWSKYLTVFKFSHPYIRRTWSREKTLILMTQDMIWFVFRKVWHFCFSQCVENQSFNKLYGFMLSIFKAHLGDYQATRPYTSFTWWSFFRTSWHIDVTCARLASDQSDLLLWCETEIRPYFQCEINFKHWDWETTGIRLYLSAKSCIKTW